MTTRAIPQGIELRVGKYKEFEPSPEIFACILQYPNSSGNVEDYADFTKKAHEADCKVAVAADILSLALLTPSGRMGSGYRIRYNTATWVHRCFTAGLRQATSPHVTSTSGICRDASSAGPKTNTASSATEWLCRHANSISNAKKPLPNICTAQALLATMAGFYAVYHGQEGIKTIASRIHSITVFLDKQLKKFGYTQVNAQYFDTLRFELPEHVSAQQIRTIALSKEVNLRYYENGDVGFSIDETTDIAATNVLLSIFRIAAWQGLKSEW